MTFNLNFLLVYCQPARIHCISIILLNNNNITHKFTTNTNIPHDTYEHAKIVHSYSNKRF